MFPFGDRRNVPTCQMFLVLQSFWGRLGHKRMSLSVSVSVSQPKNSRTICFFPPSLFLFFVILPPVSVFCSSFFIPLFPSFFWHPPSVSVVVRPWLLAVQAMLFGEQWDHILQLALIQQLGGLSHSFLPKATVKLLIWFLGFGRRHWRQYSVSLAHDRDIKDVRRFKKKCKCWNMELKDNALMINGPPQEWWRVSNVL